MRTWIALLALAGCATRESASREPPPADTGVDAASSTIAGRTFGEFEPWAKPIEDYIAIGNVKLPRKFSSAIHELAPFGGRMWLGYGDADYNMGTHTPIELRSFASQEDPTATAAPVDGKGQGADQKIPTQTGEEQIDRYRICDGNLWQPGIDSTDADELWTQATADPKPIAGNVYRLEGASWKKFRSIPGGEHVHDLACFKGAIYMVGSGSKDRPEWESGQIFRYLWRSNDLGKTFSVAHRIAHPDPGKGDTRWVHLLPTTRALYLFGYVSTFATSNSVVANARTTDGALIEDLAKDAPLAKIVALATTPLPDGTGLIVGIDVATSARVYEIWHVSADGTPKKLDAFAGKTILDIHVEPSTKELVILTQEGDLFPTPRATSWSLKLFAAPIANPNAPVEVAAHESNVEIRSVAFWNGSLFLGTEDGQALRAR